MNAFYQHHKDSIRFGYRCFDRMMPRARREGSQTLAGPPLATTQPTRRAGGDTAVPAYSRKFPAGGGVGDFAARGMAVEDPGSTPLIKNYRGLLVRIVILIGESRDDGADLGDRVMLDLECPR
jgi:hypothetical protein